MKIGRRDRDILRFEGGIDKQKLIGFSYYKKSANAVMWKNKEYEYISSA